MGLPWFRADTNLPTHDKMLDLLGRSPKGKGAAFVYVCSLAYSAGHDTSGFIAKAALPFVHGTPTEARLLAETRLWEIVEGGWQIRNWGTRQLVGAEAQAIHESAVERGRKGGQAKARGVANG
ncbi:hypothetical protein [Paramicrobacterium chengjingii]|uniref:Uncharacterized protein n=1 Tax=Paramicrobacterium chengjingii TaxID=2769067 RepID=A0ABX6YLV5_9MICO|nr:hypothetical protein [Microbacterium chengjingii]QPZ39723.1 hypothetical protein HCR76_06670 [Microbacterium chengjingii]